MDRTAYRLLQFGGDTKNLPHPPTLLKLSAASSSSSSGAPSSSQSFTETFTQTASQSKRVRCCATRLMNGQQHYLDVKVDTEELLKCYQRSLKNQRLRLEEAIDGLFEAFDNRAYTAEYDKHSKICEITFDTLAKFSISLDFDRAKVEHITPAFGIAFEAARSFASEAERAQSAAQKAQTSLKDKERDAILAEKKASNLKIDLSEARTSLQRLLATGGSSLADLPGASRALRERSTPMLDDGKDGREASESPGKKRKLAAPTFGKAGRTIQKKVETGFLDDPPSSSSSESESDSGEASGSATAKDGHRAGKKRASRSGSPSSSDATSKSKGKASARKEPLSRPGAKSASPASKPAETSKSKISTRSTAAPKPGHTARKPIDTGFLPLDGDESMTEESADDVEEQPSRRKKTT